MKIILSKANEAFVSLVKDSSQIVLLDANIFIPPDRRKLGARDSITFRVYEQVWLVPLFQTFPNLAIHEAVDKEIIKDNVAGR